MGLLSKPLACQIPAEPLTISPHKLYCSPHTERSEKRKAKIPVTEVSGLFPD